MKLNQSRRRPAHTLPHASAATATPKWRHARDNYINHLMTCRSCYAPTARYCRLGAELRATYDETPYGDTAMIPKLVTALYVILTKPNASAGSQLIASRRICRAWISVRDEIHYQRRGYEA